jgi:hypothetical protein
LNGRSPSKPGRFLTIEAEETVNGRRNIRATKKTTEIHLQPIVRNCEG